MDSTPAFGLSRPGFNPSHQPKFSSKLEEMSFGEVFQWINDFGGVMFRLDVSVGKRRKPWCNG